MNYKLFLHFFSTFALSIPEEQWVYQMERRVPPVTILFMLILVHKIYTTSMIF